MCIAKGQRENKVVDKVQLKVEPNQDQRPL